MRLVSATTLALLLAISSQCRASSNLSTSPARAREIMGANFFGVEEAVHIFGLKPTVEQASELATIPFSEQTLQRCQRTHILVAVLPLTIVAIRNHVAAGLFYARAGAWYNHQAFAQSVSSTSGWHLVNKVPVAGSGARKWHDQVSLLRTIDEVPNTQVLVYTIIGYYLSTGERLFSDSWVRCSDLASDGSRVGIRFSQGMVFIGSFWDYRSASDLRIASEYATK